MTADDKPLTKLAEAERDLKEERKTPPPPVEFESQTDESEIADAEVTEIPTHERLRRFEDAVLGEKAPRVNGHVEKGIGSPFSRMKDEHKKHHDALLELMEAEKAHIAAGQAEAAAHARLQAAIDRANATEPKD